MTVLKRPVLPVTVVPLRFTKLPEVKFAVVPVIVVPLKVPVIVTSEVKNPEPRTERFPETVKLF